MCEIAFMKCISMKHFDLNQDLEIFKFENFQNKNDIITNVFK
jgi:hypothetical protein